MLKRLFVFVLCFIFSVAVLGGIMFGVDYYRAYHLEKPLFAMAVDTVDDGVDYTITGRVPALLNGERVDLLLVFDNANPYGYIAGARTVYTEGETETVAKALDELKIGDTLDFLCDYYSYNGDYMDSYYLGEQMTVTDNMQISNVDVGEGDVKIMYRFTDIYNQQYWTEAFTE